MSEMRSPLVPVPAADAALETILDFARTYDAYDHFAADSESLDSMVGDVYADIERTAAVPDWVRLDLARALLFYACRRDYFVGGRGPYEPMRALVEHIRVLSGGHVVDRSKRTTTPHSAVVAGGVTIGEFNDSWEYSADRLYRWWYERRWGSGPALCFVGLNPATGDTDGKPRPTLGRVVGWAKREGCGAVVAVNLFAYRSTVPAAMFAAGVDIVGDRNDDAIRSKSGGAAITLAAWGGNPRAQSRAAEVVALLRDPQCVGKTKSGAPKHPLYIPKDRPFEAYT